MSPIRWIWEVFNALAHMAIILASHGPGKLPLEAVQQAEKNYLCYRENYNRAWVCIWQGLRRFPRNFCGIRKYKETVGAAFNNTVL